MASGTPVFLWFSKDGQPFNFVIFRAQKQALRIELRLERSEEIETRLDEAGLDVMEYSTRNRRYRVRLTKGDIDKHSAVLAEMLEGAYKAFIE
jgi:hypothetical protein